MILEKQNDKTSIIIIKIHDSIITESLVMKLPQVCPLMSSRNKVW